MDYAQLEKYISHERLNRFLRACGNSKNKAQKLYKINLRVSQSFYPILNLFEIFLRNAVSEQISTHFNDPEWIVNQKNLFMVHVSLQPDCYLLKQVEKAEREIRRRRVPVTASKVIAEQTFGFWTALFDAKHFPLTGGSSLIAFPYKPANINRSKMAAKIRKIREFRNRIYHNEPICFNGANIDFTVAEEVLGHIHDIIQWLNPDLKKYTDYFNNIQSKIDQAGQF